MVSCRFPLKSNKHILGGSSHFIPRIVSGLVHPSYKWALPPLIPFITRVITHLRSVGSSPPSSQSSGLLEAYRRSWFSEPHRGISHSQVQESRQDHRLFDLSGRFHDRVSMAWPWIFDLSPTYAISISIMIWMVENEGFPQNLSAMLWRWWRWVFPWILGPPWKKPNVLTLQAIKSSPWSSVAPWKMCL